MPIDQEKLRRAMVEFTGDQDQQDAPQTTPSWIMPVWNLNQQQAAGAGAKKTFWMASASVIITSATTVRNWYPASLNNPSTTGVINNSFQIGYLPPAMIPTDVTLKRIMLKYGGGSNQPNNIWAQFSLLQQASPDTPAAYIVDQRNLITPRDALRAVNLANTEYYGFEDYGITIPAYAPNALMNIRFFSVGIQAGQLYPIAWPGAGNTIVNLYAQFEHGEQGASWGREPRTGFKSYLDPAA